jgi:hypothetical protein
MEEPRLTDLPAFLVDHIGSFFSQQDRVSIALTSHVFESLYPKHLTHSFKEDATLDEYMNFVSAVVRRKIRSIEVSVDPLKWNQTQRVWRGVRFDTVVVYPNTLHTLGSIVDMPDASVVRSGFFDASALERLITSFQVNAPGNLQLTAYRSSGQVIPLPWISPNLVHTLELVGKFTCFERIPKSVSVVNLRHRHVTRADLEMLDSIACIGLQYLCTFDESCRGYTFDLTCLTLNARDLNIIGSASRLQRVDVRVRGDPGHAWTPGHIVLHDLVADVTVSGLADASLETVITYFKACFPDARSIRFDQLSVMQA